MAPRDPNLQPRPMPAHAGGSAHAHPTASPRRPTFALLYERHWRGVLSALRCSGIPERDLPDVAQDVFVGVHASLPRFDPSRRVEPWLYTIAYRTAQDHLRSARFRRTRLGRSEEGVETIDPAPSPELRTLISEAEHIFGEVVQELNDDQRAAYLLSVKEGFSISEIAEALDENENTVRSRLHRAQRTFDAALARRRDVEERRKSPVASFLAPMALVDAVRTGAEADPAVKAAVWGRLARVLGLGIIGRLAPLSGPAIVGAAAIVAVLGGVAGAMLHATLGRSVQPETMVRAETAPRTADSGAAGDSPSATASAGAAAPGNASASAYGKRGAGGDGGPGRRRAGSGRPPAHRDGDPGEGARGDGRPALRRGVA